VGSEPTLHITFVDWIGIGVFIGLAIFASTRIRSIWHGATNGIKTRWARGIPAWFVVGWLMIVALPVVLFAMSRPQPVSPWVAYALLLSLLAVAVAILIAALVTLTGHPRGMVPPSLRGNRAVE